MNKQYLSIFFFIFLLFSLLFISGCSKSVSQVLENKEEYLGEKISVYGTVESSIKIFSFSGYTLKDEKTNETLFIKTDSLKEEGKKIEVAGVLMKERGIYYLLEK